jgi:hypothetical protein
MDINLPTPHDVATAPLAENTLFELGEPLLTPKPASSGGTPRLRYVNREQAEMRFCSLDDLIAADHEVRSVWSYVTGLDLSEGVHSRNGVMQLRRNSLRVIEVAAWAE